ncbi:hypothetical protein LAZ67_2005523 [Cordylochernes scorpioides]|uniref:Mos1 transposase HTH domain-containing protein n=1 Tax=Cordylochernes scorpioides TaxID=51811 RepID=A0ABY6K5B6_9ARAC|nr:hypothetical protein LAZ67_2005523 [Cordylochernes scorpioides]
MDQKSGETISKYIIRLKEQAQRCNFGDFLQESLRDRFVAGIIDTSTQKKLLQEEGLTFEGALDIALSAESADNDLHNIKRSENAHQSPQHLHAINNACKHCGKDTNLYLYPRYKVNQVLVVDTSLYLKLGTMSTTAYVPIHPRPRFNVNHVLDKDTSLYFYLRYKVNHVLDENTSLNLYPRYKVNHVLDKNASSYLYSRYKVNHVLCKDTSLYFYLRFNVNHVLDKDTSLYFNLRFDFNHVLGKDTSLYFYLRFNVNHVLDKNTSLYFYIRYKVNHCLSRAAAVRKGIHFARASILLVTEMEDQRICIKFCVKNEFKGAEIFWMFQTAYGVAVMSRRRVFEWYKRFKEGREETADNERSGRPFTSTTPEKVDKVFELVHEDRRITVREVAEEAGISFGSTQSIMKDILGVRRLNAAFSFLKI